MTKRAATQPALHPLFRLAPGERVTYWPIASIADSERETMFKAARQAADDGHVRLHLRRVGDACEHVAVGRVR